MRSKPHAHYSFESATTSFSTNFKSTSSSFNTKFDSKRKDFSSQIKSENSVFRPEYIKVSPASFPTKFKQIGATAPIPEQDIIIYDGGNVEGWEAEDGEAV